MFSVFLSHNSKDKVFVRRLAETLRSNDIRVWLDEAEIEIGDSLIDKVSEAIHDTDFIAAVISKNSIGSHWVKKELSLAMSKEIKNKKVVVLPILLDRCELPNYLKDKLYVDFTIGQNYAVEVKKLIRAITHHGNEEKTLDKNKGFLTKIDRTALRFGIPLGWQIGRFEFIYGSQLDEAISVEKDIQDDISLLLGADGYGELPAFQTVQELTKKILINYSVKSPEKHAAILLGIAAMRITLVGSSKNTDHNKQIEEIALSAILEADNTIIQKKRELFDILMSKRPQNIPTLLELLDSFTE